MDEAQEVIDTIEAQVAPQEAKPAVQGPSLKDKIRAKWVRFKEFLQECRRVLLVTKKPTKDEFKTIFKISGLGILLIGFIGFLIHLVKTYLF